MLASDTKCHQANRLAVSSASHTLAIRRQHGFGRKGHQHLFPGNLGCQDKPPRPFPSTVIDRDRCFQNFITLFSEEETAFFIRLKTCTNNISKEKFYHLPAYVRFLSPHEF